MALATNKDDYHFNTWKRNKFQSFTGAWALALRSLCKVNHCCSEFNQENGIVVIPHGIEL